MADESSPTLYNSEFESNNESEAQASDSKGKLRTRHKSEPERWWVARRYEVARTRDCESHEVLHLTRYPSKRLFSLIWHPYCNEGRCGKRDDTKLSRPLDILGWEPCQEASLRECGTSESCLRQRIFSGQTQNYKLCRQFSCKGRGRKASATCLRP